MWSGLSSTSFTGLGAAKSAREAREKRNNRQKSQRTDEALHWNTPMKTAMVNHRQEGGDLVRVRVSGGANNRAKRGCERPG